MIFFRLSVLSSERDFNTYFLQIKARTDFFYDFQGISFMPLSWATLRDKT